jgi:polar amino acid transport system substrate-binding protein
MARVFRVERKETMVGGRGMMMHGRMTRRRLLGVASVGLACSAWLASRPETSAAAGLLAQIKARGYVTVATEADYEPYESVENGKIVGYDEDILHLIIRDWGVQLHQLDLPFQGILPGLLEGKYDFVCTALLINPERAARYAFTQPVAVAQVGVLKRKGDDRIKAAEDIAGLVVGAPIPPGGPTTALMHFNDQLKARGKGVKQIRYFQSSPDIIVALANRQIDAAVNIESTFVPAMRRRPGAFEIVGTFGPQMYVGWVTRPQDPDLRDFLNTEIRKQIASGQITALQKKWFGYTMSLPTSGYLPPGAK